MSNAGLVAAAVRAAPSVVVALTSWQYNSDHLVDSNHYVYSPRIPGCSYTSSRGYKVRLPWGVHAIVLYKLKVMVLPLVER